MHSSRSPPCTQQSGITKNKGENRPALLVLRMICTARRTILCLLRVSVCGFRADSSVLASVMPYKKVDTKDRVARLRVLLKENSVDGYIVPTDDAHQVGLCFS